MLLQAEKIELLMRENRKLQDELDGKYEPNVQDTQAQTQGYIYVTAKTCLYLEIYKETFHIPKL